MASIPQGNTVELTAAGPVDWVHWGLYTESSLDRKANVAPAISDFTTIDPTNSGGYTYVYRFADNYNGYSWMDGTPTPAATNSTTGVWAYGVPVGFGSGFRFTVPADPTLRILRVYVGAFAAQGKLEASLSDGSAPVYVDTSFGNPSGNGESAVFSISYAADSAGQSLTVNWTLLTGSGSTPNVTLMAAALEVDGANNPPTVSLAAPEQNGNFLAGSDIAIDANAQDFDGDITQVEFYSGANKIGGATARPFNFTWTNVPPGAYVLTARATDNGGAVSTSNPVEIFVNTGGGSLNGNVALPSSGVDLTAEGTLDWAHWALKSRNGFDHKAGVAQQISKFTKLGTNAFQRLADYYIGFDWSDGTPTAATNGTTTGVYTTGLANGFLVTAPATTNVRTLKVYVGLYGEQGQLQAYLSDFSAPAYIDTSLDSVYGNAYAVYTLNYASATAGQQLTVKYVAKAVYDGDYGNVTLESATLSGASAPSNAPPRIAITDPTNHASFAAPATILIVTKAEDGDGTISQVEFFNDATKIGQSTESPFSFTWTNVLAGEYTLTAQATDNLSAVTVSSPVSISVTSAPPALVLENPGTAGNEFYFSFETQAGFTYEVQAGDSFNPFGWQSVTNFTGSGTPAVVTNALTPGVRFFRVEVR